jgi:hypothetical protein
MYIGSGSAALVELEIAAWQQGYAAMANPPLRDMDEIHHAACAACDEALSDYIPLDQDRFCDIFTLAWSAGYCMHVREVDRARAPVS